VCFARNLLKIVQATMRPRDFGPESNTIDQIVGKTFAGPGLCIGIFDIVQQVLLLILAFCQFV